MGGVDLQASGPPAYFRLLFFEPLYCLLWGYSVGLSLVTSAGSPPPFVWTFTLGLHTQWSDPGLRCPTTRRLCRAPSCSARAGLPHVWLRRTLACPQVECPATLSSISPGTGGCSLGTAPGVTSGTTQRNPVRCLPWHVTREWPLVSPLLQPRGI